MGIESKPEAAARARWTGGHCAWTLLEAGVGLGGLFLLGGHGRAATGEEQLMRATASMLSIYVA